jgi:hypothetical protein
MTTLIAKSYFTAMTVRQTPEQKRLHREHRELCEREELLREKITLRQGDVADHYESIEAVRNAKRVIAQQMFALGC